MSERDRIGVQLHALKLALQARSGRVSLQDRLALLDDVLRCALGDPAFVTAVRRFNRDVDRVPAEAGTQLHEDIVHLGGLPGDVATDARLEGIQSERRVARGWLFEWEQAHG